MFEALLDRIEVIPVEEEELDRVFSVDPQGRAVTLGEYLSQYAERTSKLGPSARRSPVPVRDTAMSSLSDDEVSRLVEEYLSSFPEHEVVRFMDSGSFTPDELREQVRQGTPVGQRVIEIAVEGHEFMKEAIRRGKVKVLKKSR